MKILLSLIILFVPISILAKQVCIAPSGCSIEIDTGFCPKCIEVKEEPPIIKEEKVVVVQKPIVKIPTKKKPSQLEVSKTKKKKGVCYVPPCDWLDTPSITKNYSLQGKKPRTTRTWNGCVWRCVVGGENGRCDDDMLPEGCVWDTDI